MTLEEELKKYGLDEWTMGSIKERAKCKAVYDRYKEAMEGAQGIKAMLDAAEIEYEGIEGKNNWHESAIKDKFGIEILPELQEFYSLGLDTTEGIIYDFDTALRLNHDFRHDPAFTDLYLPFDNYYIFGQEGNGDFFMLGYNKNLELKLDFFLWDHETDSRSVYCWRFGEYLARRSSGFGGYSTWTL